MQDRQDILLLQLLLLQLLLLQLLLLLTEDHLWRTA